MFVQVYARPHKNCNKRYKSENGLKNDLYTKHKEKTPGNH